MKNTLILVPGGTDNGMGDIVEARNCTEKDITL